MGLHFRFGIKYAFGYNYICWLIMYTVQSKRHKDYFLKLPSVPLFLIYFKFFIKHDYF